MLGHACVWAHLTCPCALYYGYISVLSTVGVGGRSQRSNFASLSAPSMTVCVECVCVLSAVVLCCVRRRGPNGAHPITSFTDFQFLEDGDMVVSEVGHRGFMPIHCTDIKITGMGA